VAELLQQRGYRVGNVDLTIVAERPRIGPHSLEMRDQIARVLLVDLSQVSVKATTNEGIGFLGREEGIAAWAVATIVSAP
jgi:2-C-methyl-D-erythritol 2,4-cyclodiphosphate synthase